jgi:nucleoside-diphosphate-sugar epimerase
MRALVTGASGLLGRPLVARLLAASTDVVALVHPADEGGAARLAEVGACVAAGDVADAAAVDAAVAGCDLVYHLAGIVPARGWSRSDFARVNAFGTEVVARAAARAGVAHLVHASSVAVHGIPDRPPAGEDAPLVPVNAYQATKLAGERAVLRAAAEDGLSATIARLTPVYGPGDRRALPLFRDVARGRLWMVGRGAQPYQLTYVDDAVEALLRCGARRGDCGTALILGSDERFRVRDLVAAIAAAVGGAPRILSLPALPVALAWRLQRHLARRAVAAEDPARAPGPLPGLADRLDFFLAERTWDVSRARAELGAWPHVALRDGVVRAARWYRERGWLSENGHR